VANIITETWLAYAFDRPARLDRVRRGLERVGAHYGPQVETPPPLRASAGELTGMALWRNDDAESRWPAWDEGGGFVVGSTGAPAGWERIVGDLAPRDAALPLAGVLHARPERAGELTPPFVVGIREPATEQLTIVNDFISAGRIYELRFEATGPLGPAGKVWSNRLGALPVFAGIAPRADERGWALFAAAGWFIGNSTSIAGAAKVPGGSVIRVRVRAGRAEVKRDATGAIGELVPPREAQFEESVAAATDQAMGVARNVEALFDRRVQIDLSGGRDSRLSAAAACAAGIEHHLRTGDTVPGEVAIAKRLVELAPRRLRHRIRHPERGKPRDELRERLRNLHYVHDAMRQAQEVRTRTSLPRPVTPLRPVLSGHGGELAHGFYYANAAQLRQIRGGGERAILKRLERAGRRYAAAARKEAYDLYRSELEQVLDEGRALGLAGPTLLDYFYLTQRFAFRSGLGARSGRYSCCGTPAFVRAAFDLTPEERQENKLHLAMIASLVPEWRDVPFLRPEDTARLPTVHRARIWEKPGHADAVGEMLGSEDGGWAEIFQAELVRRMWRKALAGKGHRHYEGVFEQVVWRVGFEDHLDELARAARG
jgi:hypothetical protein